MKPQTFAFALLAGALAVPVFAESSMSSSAGSDTPQAVLSAIHMDNQHEIQAGQLAQQKGASAEVKDFGQTLSRDHGAADQKVQALARKKGVALNEPPADPAKAQHAAHEKQEMARLQKLSGPAFDQAFMAAMASGHQETIAHLEKAKATVGDKDVQQLIDELMPTLQKHAATAAQGTEGPSGR